MAQQIENVLLMGATGNLGPTVLDALVKSGKFNVTVTTRKESHTTFPDGVKVIKTDYSESSLPDLFKGQDAVVCNIGGAVLGEQHRFIDAAEKAGVKRFLSSEFGSNTTNKNAQEICPVFGMKDQVNNYLQTKAEQNPNFTWTAMMTGGFFDWCLKVGFTGFDLKTNTATIWDSGNTIWSTTNLSMVGKSVVSTLLHPDETKNRHVWVQSFATSQNEVLAALEKSTGQKWQVNRVKKADQVKAGREKLSKGDMSGIMLLILAAIYSEDPDVGADFTKAAKLDNDVLGLPQEDLQATVNAVVKGEA